MDGLEILTESRLIPFCAELLLGLPDVTPDYKNIVVLSGRPSAQIDTTLEVLVATPCSNQPDIYLWRD